MSLEDYEAFFDESLDDPEFFENGGVDTFFEVEDLCGAERDVARLKAKVYLISYVSIL